MAGSISDNVALVRERIEGAARRAGRSSGDVTLIAVSKTQPVSSIIAARQAGITDFGENRVHEAITKFAESKASTPEQVAREGITLHLIGSLQRNKARVAAQSFDVIHSVDRVDLVAELTKATECVPTPLRVLLEVNMSGEASKGGVAPGGLDGLADALAGSKGLVGVGLMTVARMGAEERELRATFAGLRGLLAGLQRTMPGEWRHLSMGMSDDFEYAIEEGATLVRVGRAIFGERRLQG